MLVNQDNNAYNQTAVNISGFNSGSIAMPINVIKQLPPRAKSNYRSNKVERLGNSKTSSKYKLKDQNSLNLASIENDLYQTQISQVTRSSKPENLIIRSTRGITTQQLATNSSKH